MLCEPGGYLPDWVQPQDADREIDGGFPDAHPAAMAETRVLADHHALTLDLHAMEPKQMPRSEKYNTYTLAIEAWRPENSQLLANPRFQKLAERVRATPNIERRHSELMSILLYHLEDRLAGGKDSGRPNKTAASETHAQHELSS